MNYSPITRTLALPPHTFQHPPSTPRSRFEKHKKSGKQTTQFLWLLPELHLNTKHTLYKVGQFMGPPSPLYPGLNETIAWLLSAYTLCHAHGDILTQEWNEMIPSYLLPSKNI